MTAMLAVRYTALAALAVWLGGMVALALIVAPSVFRVLQGADPAGGATLAGAVFGEVLRQFHLLAYACGGVIFVSLFVMKFMGPPPSSFVLRAAIVAVMLGLAGYSGLWVTRAIERLQAEVDGPIGALARSDPRRIDFERLHQRSATLMTVNMGLGFVLLFWYARD